MEFTIHFLGTGYQGGSVQADWSKQNRPLFSFIGVMSLDNFNKTILIFLNQVNNNLSLYLLIKYSIQFVAIIITHIMGLCCKLLLHEFWLILHPLNNITILIEDYKNAPKSNYFLTNKKYSCTTKCNVNK